MTNPIQAYLKSIHTASTSQSDKKAALDALNQVLGTKLDSNEIFEQLHENILRMFEEYAIFSENIKLISPMIHDRLWITIAQHVERFIINQDYPRESGETPLRRGLIQVYLYYFASRYLNRPEYTYKFIQRKFMNLKNLNRLQSDRQLVFSELLVRIKSANEPNINLVSTETIIPRKKLIHSLGERLEAHPFLMLIGPQGMGKSVALKLIAESFQDNWQIYSHQFTSHDQISHPDYFTSQMLSFFKSQRKIINKPGAHLYLLDDLHILPPVLHEVLRKRVLPEILRINNLPEKEIAVIVTSAFPLDGLMTFQMDSPRFMPYFLDTFTAAEVDLLWNKSPHKSSYLPEKIYNVTRGYPALVGQMISSKVTFDNSLWFNALFRSVNWDDSHTELMKALCTFRYIGPFFLNNLAKYLNDPYLLWEIWHIPETILDPTLAHSMWEKLVQRNPFIQRISNDRKEFPINKNFVILRVLRQLAENAVRSDQPAIYDQRHKLASEYYYSQINDPVIPSSKKPLLIIEYLFHLVKQELSTLQILSIIDNLLEFVKNTEKSADVHRYTNLFLSNFVEDIELKETMEETLFNDIVTIAHKELGI